jgi:hypothetical protein
LDSSGLPFAYSPGFGKEFFLIFAHVEDDNGFWGVQFIFATHNANFPVLGDAEQVGACSFTAGTGSIQIGSIDEPGIQKAIVSIMEGGQEAFARRKEIYQLWKQ